MFSIFIPAFKFLFHVVFFIIFLYFFLMFSLILIAKTKNKSRFERILLKPKKLPLWINFVRWILIDLLRGKVYPVWGIYIFVAKPGNGKTISMTEHICRVKSKDPKILVYTNFNYKGQDGVINNWQDIFNAPDNCLICVDELHMLASSGGYQEFPVEALGEITQNRHSRKQFVTSTQDYDLVNVNFKRVTNYVVLCGNVWGLDRLFTNHYFDRGTYESKGFLAQIKKCNFARYFVASDETYARYDTLEKITNMVQNLEGNDRNGTIQKLKDVLNSKELISKESKYIQGIIERINDVTANTELWENKEREIINLKEQIKKLQMAV